MDLIERNEKVSEMMAAAIYNADRNNWFAGCDYADLHEDDKNRLRAMAKAAREILSFGI